MRLHQVLVGAAASAAAHEFAALDVAQKAVTGDAFVAYKMLIEWSQIPPHLPESISRDFLVAVDCAANRPLCDDQDVASFPALRYYSSKGMERYRGPRTAMDIAMYLKSIQRPLVTSLKKPDIAGFSARDGTTFIVHVPGTDDEATALLLGRLDILAARHGREIAFGVHRTKVAAPRAECFNSETGERFEAANLDAIDALEVLARKCSQPVIRRFSRQNELELMSVQASLVLFHSPSSAARLAFAEAFRGLALRYQAYLVFVTSDSGAYPEILPAGSTADDEKPVLSVLNPHAWATFVMPPDVEITPEAVETFIGQISRGEVPAVGGAEGQNGGLTESEREGKDEL
ncbi:hypothetical protein TD95_001635 [Thielaviopsis punctulata]|uniref:Thioredoxin domain-containing protein n=1 Tax=Thielaviopsis punctulata TaxID=72032 RepID=A0A0F4ZA16_9PEZI|nr:hypothetical protein TD95_001635 [Thielaviopsis punctulata]